MLHTHLTRLVAAYTGCDANDTRAWVHTHALLGEVLAFRLGKLFCYVPAGRSFDEEKAELIYQTVTCHIDLILHGFNAKESGLMKKTCVVIGLAIATSCCDCRWNTNWYQSRQDDGLTLYGNVDIRTVNISFRVGGRLASLVLMKAILSKPGQVLGELDHAPYENANAGESWRVGRAGAI